MKGPYGLELNDGCKSCKLSGLGFFCHLGPAALKEFDEIKSTSTYPKGALLFVERQDARGVFVLCEGEVKLSISSTEGKTLIMRIARPGELLGLIATMAGTAYEVTAETLHPCQIAFVRREDFQRYLANHPDASQNVLHQMSSQYQDACEQLRTVGLSSSANEKLARLLLTWSVGLPKTKSGTRITMPLTHEEIAEFIGTTRETVTRTLSEFKTRHLIAIQGSTLTIPNRAALESIANISEPYRRTEHLSQDEGERQWMAIAR
jgi:CRP/FNR family cyclic AMP-dependent transcriptional regulator